MKYKISIIIPIYNMAHFLETCLNSVCTQTLKDLEIICINDASSDNSEEIVLDYLQRDSRIKYIKIEKNIGSGAARNMGIDIAKGMYMAFLDPDDYYYDVTVLEKLYNAGIEHHVNAVAGNMYSINIAQKREGIFIPELHFSASKLYSFRNEYPACFGYQSFIFKTKIIQKNNLYFPDYLRRQDPVFFLNVMLHIEEFYGIDYYIYVYKQYYKQIKWNKRKRSDFILAYRDNFETLIKHDMQKQLLSEFTCFRNDIINEEHFLNTKHSSELMANVLKQVFYKILKKIFTPEVAQHEIEAINNIYNQFKESNFKNILIYGFGNVGIGIYEKCKNIYNISCIVDKKFQGYYINNIEVEDCINQLDPDTLVVLTILNCNTISEIKTLLSKKVSRSNQIISIL